MTTSETPLVERAASGDRGAYSVLVESHWARLVGLARTVVGDATAEDVVQDALVVAWDRLASLRDIESFSPWLTRIVMRRCLHRRRSWRDWLPLSAAVEPSARPDLDSGLDLERCLRGLAPRQRAVMALSVVEGQSDGEIAEILDITAASVRSHRRRARERLRRTMADAYKSFGADTSAEVGDPMGATDSTGVNDVP
ncbi:MAG: sigma-70 family RNA polymerase sigma factor [Acidobacteriota bacterium]